MAAWFIPALKAVLPHLGLILSAAVPVFTKKTGDAAANQALLLQQISELQSAASQNAEHIKKLAAQLQATVASLEQAAAIAESRFRRGRFLCGSAMFLIAAFLGLAFYFILGQK